MEGITANVKLLLKLLNDHNEASQKGSDPRQVQRLAGMMSILEDAKARIQKSQISGKKRQAELRRCNTDLKPHRPSDKGKTGEGPTLDEKEKLRRDLNMSFAAQKRLGVMCSSLGKEKQIIARELSRKVQELKGMEELLNDYKAQNEKLAEKVHAFRAKYFESECLIRVKLKEARQEVEIGKGLFLILKERLAKCEGVDNEIENMEKVLECIEVKLSN